MVRTSVAALLVGTIGLLAGPVFAGETDGDTPWTPKKFPRSKLLDTGTHTRAPLDLPWEVRSTDRVANYSRLDFKFVLDADFEEVKSHFEDAFKNQSTVLELRRFAVPDGVSRKMTVAGAASSGDARKYTLQHEPTRRDFLVQLQRENGATVLILQNAPITRIFGSGVPTRAPFKPFDADPIPFFVR